MGEAALQEAPIQGVPRRATRSFSQGMKE